jgi:DNA helicase-2/ATP-dependent DNA helicase PcrA
MNRQMREQLNDAQQEAVTSIDGPVLVIAGAGTGKTRVIEYRVRYLVESGVNPAAILLLTFTRRAAQEMISRAAKSDPRCGGVEGGTFHSFANRLLRTYSSYFGLPNTFTIYDEADAEEAVHRCAVQLGFYARQKRRPRKEMLRKILSMALNREMPLEDVLVRYYPGFEQYLDEITALRQRYMEYKIASQCLDYDDLLLYLKLLLENDDIRSRIARTYQYIMVDEFQDTNIMQADIAYRLAEGHRRILVVGDDAQSIYSFRGASHENIMRFPEHFPGCRILTLDENYRSTQAILDLGNAVLENMSNKYEKCLHAAKKAKGERPYLIYFKDAYEEAAWIADRIKAFCDEGMELSHQCILFRSAYIAIPLQTELSRRNIPFAVYGGLKFYETGHVKDVIAHLKLLENPKDELAWNRALLLIPGVGPRTADRLLQEIAGCETLDAVVTTVIERHSRTAGSTGEGLARLGRMLAAAGAADNPGERCRLTVEYYEPLLREKFDLDWHLRKNDLDAVVQIAERYPSIRTLLVDLAIEPPERGIKDFHDTIWERPLILSTIHSAKGLEWRNVFLIGAVEGVLPSSYTTHDDEGLEEEHRLLYVAITRARERLYVLAHHEARNNGIRTFNRLSRFIDAANVRACLDKHHPFPTSAENEGDAATVPVLDRQELISRLLDSLK